MYTIVRDLLDNCIKETPDVWDWATELAIVGGEKACDRHARRAPLRPLASPSSDGCALALRAAGVMINRRSGGDFFQPLSFELRTQFLADGPPTDVYAETFGERPDLLPILGSEEAVKRVLQRSKPGENKARL